MIKVKTEINPHGDIRLSWKKSADIVPGNREGLNHGISFNFIRQVMCRPQNTLKRGISEKIKAVPELNQDMPSMVNSKNRKEYVTEDLFEKFIARDNFARAYKQVIGNKGFAGVDKMTVEALYSWLIVASEFLESIRQGEYSPKPVKRITIQKPDGGVRNLGVPTVLNRMVQQAIVQVLTPTYEAHFSESSFGFRPGRSAHGAILKAKQYYERGMSWTRRNELVKKYEPISGKAGRQSAHELPISSDWRQAIRQPAKGGASKKGSGVLLRVQS